MPLGAIVEKAVGPRAGLDRIVQELYRPILTQEPVVRFAASPTGLDHLYGCYYVYGDIEERPTEVSLAGKYGSEAVAELNRRVQEHAESWVRDRGEVSVDPSWLAWNNGTVSKLATVIRDQRQFELLPVLADALEEAGCRDQLILSHCRESAPHEDKCWVVELLLNRNRS